MRHFRKILAITLFILIGYGVQYAWRAAPILTGYGAKILCSCAFVGGRAADDIIANELGQFPISVGTFRLHLEDSSATAHVLGLARKKAVYRDGLGCTLVNGVTEAELRAQRYTPPRHIRVNTDTIDWPIGDRVSDSLPEGLDANALKKAVEKAFDEPGPTPGRRTRAILVVYDGKIISEQYAPGFDRHSRLAGWSMAKSLTNALVGKLVSQNKLAVDKPTLVEQWQNDERVTITLDHLLHASTGLEWTEVYGGPSDATNMLFKEEHMGFFAAGQPLQFAPGGKWYYSSGTSNIISMIIRQSIDSATYYSFPYREVFHPIGMFSLVLEPDAGGTFVGSSYAHATARDWARFGLLYYNRGKFNGNQILPEEWIRYSTAPAPAAPRGEYGAQIWLNAGQPGKADERIFPRLPPDLYWADGYEGQNVFVIPSQKLVVVKLSLTHSGGLNDEEFLQSIIDALPK